MTRKPPKTPLLEAVHETARDLARLGLIEKRTMRKYDALCLVPLEPFDAERIRSLRSETKLSQAVLAAVLNTSASTIGKRESGGETPERSLPETFEPAGAQGP